eukprot:1172664-Rhodomonas_salina.1
MEAVQNNNNIGDDGRENRRNSLQGKFRAASSTATIERHQAEDVTPINQVTGSLPMMLCRVLTKCIVLPGKPSRQKHSTNPRSTSTANNEL